MAEELSELHEHAEQGREHPALVPVTVTMALLAVGVAMVALLGHRAHTEEILAQSRATDQWAYYQAKNIRRHNYEMGVELLAMIEFKDQSRAEQVQEKYRQEAERYKKEQAEIEEQAKELEHESTTAQRAANRFDLGEVFLEVGLVITSLTLLTRKRLYWAIGIAAGATGVAVAATGLLIR